MQEQVGVNDEPDALRLPEVFDYIQRHQVMIVCRITDFHRGEGGNGSYVRSSLKKDNRASRAGGGMLPVERVAVAWLSTTIERHAIPPVRLRQKLFKLSNDGIEQLSLSKRKRSVFRSCNI